MVTIAGIRGLKDDEFNLIKDVIYRESGIRLTEMKKALVQARLMKRLRELKLPDYREYCHFLTNNYDREIINLINCITTNKTDFFREPKHFEFLQEVALPELEHSGRKRITIWSAGCSTGAEPYTIAITLREYFAGRSMPEVKILATDIDTQVLRRGEEGIYSYNEVDTINIELLRRYFKRGTGENEGFFKVKDSVQNMISFRRLNLLDDTYPMKGRFDIIFCRNVIIYFDTASRNRLFEKFHACLSDDGYLIMGHSETLAGMTTRFRFVGHTIYRKVE
ncbi:MAG TPA: protein-glutamate O-methyltransferase CheR [Spirochaetota bacterium]|nr:protein-glutamate O-methyltransferase CheR [Spirochaetota bacterium]HOD13786.1 protein-glutamate O-methyltransferase CheR [Spirochaetota bacterium]HPG51079.1 protein-glutamate O-methyltransferase CheR [Spirochaetota bacterium]HPN11926.1 protein-glutamate O-methyltransferase CheR [Spirochaetota bacterium]HQL81268.1 protein-glutamate O-methyltransferase CheR [Spirochaetota bacterium]